jgi:Contractile injection system tube protein/LysM domain
MVASATIAQVDVKSLETMSPPITVDFNPQSLRLTHTATGPASSQGTKSQTSETTTVPRQVTGFSTSLTMELLFDTSRDGSDVRQTTLKLVALVQPRDGAAVAKAVRFSWGTFLFIGYLESLGETIDLFSSDGVPLRATMSLSLRGIAPRDSRPESADGGGSGGGALGAGAGAGGAFGASVGASASAGFGASAGASAGFGASASAGFKAGAGASASASAGASASFGASGSVGTTPLTLSLDGDSVQSIAARAGIDGSWKAVAAANAIDNPRVLPPGTVLDLHASASLT